MTLPAGLLPSDLNIEIFADPDNFGKCLFIQYGKTHPFHELPLDIIPKLYRECFLDKKAIKGLKLMGVKPEAMVEHYNYCNRGAFDSIPDILTSGKLTKEFFDCGRRGQCPGEGLVCKRMINGIEFTPREIECLELNAEGKSYGQIALSMGFKNRLPVNSLMARLRDKTGATSKSALIAFSRQLATF